MASGVQPSIVSAQCDSTRVSRTKSPCGGPCAMSPPGSQMQKVEPSTRVTVPPGIPWLTGSSPADHGPVTFHLRTCPRWLKRSCLPARRDRCGPRLGGRPVRLGRCPPQVPAIDPASPAKFDLPALPARLAQEGGLLSVRHRSELARAAARAPPGWCQSRPDVKARNVFGHTYSLAKPSAARQGRKSRSSGQFATAWPGGPRGRAGLRPGRSGSVSGPWALAGPGARRDHRRDRRERGT